MTHSSSNIDLKLLEKELEVQIREFLHSLYSSGMDESREGLVKTPERVSRAVLHLLRGYTYTEQDIVDLFTTFDSENCDQMVTLEAIEFYSLCEHHLMPFYGRMTISYIPKKKVVGISKLARLADIFACRMQIQERIGEQIVDAIMENLDPLGAACYIEGVHLCMRARGIRKQNSVMKTSALKGAFRNDPSARSEFFQVAHTNGGVL